MSLVIVGQEKNISIAAGLYDNVIKEIITSKAIPKTEKMIFLFLKI